MHVFTTSSSGVSQCRKPQAIHKSRFPSSFCRVSVETSRSVRPNLSMEIARRGGTFAFTASTTVASMLPTGGVSRHESSFCNGTTGQGHLRKPRLPAEETGFQGPALDGIATAKGAERILAKRGGKPCPTSVEWDHLNELGRWHQRRQRRSRRWG